MKNLEVILRNGVRFNVICEKWSIKTSFNSIVEYNFEKCKERPVYIDINEIVAVLEREDT